MYFQGIEKDPLFLFYCMSSSWFYKSKLTSIDVSVTWDIGRGWANFATAINSLALLYIPTVVTYGVKYEPVAKLYKVLSKELPDIIVGFWEKLNSFWRNVHLYCDSYIVVVLSNEQVMFEY